MKIRVDPIHLRYVMPGAAYLSVCELSSELAAVALFKDDAANSLKQVALLTGTKQEQQALWKTAMTAYESVKDQGMNGEIEPGHIKLLEAAGKSGKAADVTNALTKGK